MGFTGSSLLPGLGRPNSPPGSPKCPLTPWLGTGVVAYANPGVTWGNAVQGTEMFRLRLARTLVYHGIPIGWLAHRLLELLLEDLAMQATNNLARMCHWICFWVCWNKVGCLTNSIPSPAVHLTKSLGLGITRTFQLELRSRYGPRLLAKVVA